MNMSRGNWIGIGIVGVLALTSAYVVSSFKDVRHVWLLDCAGDPDKARGHLLTQEGISELESGRDGACIRVSYLEHNKLFRSPLDLPKALDGVYGPGRPTVVSHTAE